MIGQKNLIKTFGDMIDSEGKRFPQFVILIGMKGSGRKTLSNIIYHKMNNVKFTNKFILEDVKVDTIRNMIDSANRSIDNTLFIIPDADKMSVSAKNTLLKVTEEPPKNAWFILLLEDERNTLATLRSRGQVFRIEPYSPEQIVEYARSKYELGTDEIEIIADICEVPGEVDLLHDNGIMTMYSFVQLVISNIAECSGSNAFKIGDKIAFKDTDTEKFDLRLFWKAFMKICADKLKSEGDVLKYADAISITSKYLQQLNITGLNRSATFDMWILDVRESWL